MTNNLPMLALMTLSISSCQAGQAGQAGRAGVTAQGASDGAVAIGRAEEVLSGSFVFSIDGMRKINGAI